LNGLTSWAFAKLFRIDVRLTTCELPACTAAAKGGGCVVLRVKTGDVETASKLLAVRRSVTVRATPDAEHIFDGSEEVAHHIRCYDKGQQIEDKAHLEALQSTSRITDASR